MSWTSNLRFVAKRAAQGTAITAGVGATSTLAYVNLSSNGLGLKREAHFWGVISPVVLDYWWHTSKRSPYTKLRRILSSDDVHNQKTEGSEGSSPSQERTDIMAQLHRRNAPKIFDVIVQLGGLYIKLGQVLSVTALPLPEPYRVLFRSLQSNVPGHEEFEAVVKPTLERELRSPLADIFSSFEEVPCGTASIGQAHKATLKSTGEDVIVKVQYPDARWQVPADIHCVGDFLKLCVWFGLVDEDAGNLSYKEFSRQFLAELDYSKELENLQQVYESTFNPASPYGSRGVVVPSVFPELSTNQVITMEYLPGPKFEEEAKRQLALLGVDTTKSNLRDVVRDASDASSSEADDRASSKTMATRTPATWRGRLAHHGVHWLNVDMLFSCLRVARRAFVWSKSIAVMGVQTAHALIPSAIPEDWRSWAEQNEQAAELSTQMAWTEDAVYALLDVHGYQILNQGLFNADPHPGNILILPPNSRKTSLSKEARIGLIDFGQCKRLSDEERLRVAKLILSVADNESNAQIADHFRKMGVQTKNDSTKFLAEFAKLMFGRFQSQHLDHSWHKALHEEDRILYFPNELSMVYRTSFLLRGLAMSLQYNVAVGKLWKTHAVAAVASLEKVPR